ncbi:MAG: hypothetical protein IH876_11430 [Gemmatimonadetes bacterium]|nr:hypothetical protein [Gemmatimonadota bacterium]
MSNVPKALVSLAALAFVLAAVGALMGQTIMGMGPEGFSRACTNLALLAIGVSFAWNSGSSQTKGA